MFGTTFSHYSQIDSSYTDRPTSALYSRNSSRKTASRSDTERQKLIIPYRILGPIYRSANANRDMTYSFSSNIRYMRDSIGLYFIWVLGLGVHTFGNPLNIFLFMVKIERTGVMVSVI